MQLIMKTEFDNLRLNNAHSFDSNTNGDKQVVKIYCDQQLIAKMIKLRKSVRYLAIKDYQAYLTS